jgi:hypothetical protein
MTWRSSRNIGGVETCVMLPFRILTRKPSLECGGSTPLSVELSLRLEAGAPPWEGRSPPLNSCGDQLSKSAVKPAHSKTKKFFFPVRHKLI